MGNHATNSCAKILVTPKLAGLAAAKTKRTLHDNILGNILS
jgi:hypothetical protein